MEIVRDEMGTPYNWALLKPSKDALEIFDAGSGSVVELSKVLERSAKVRDERGGGSRGGADPNDRCDADPGGNARDVRCTRLARRRRS